MLKEIIDSIVEAEKQAEEMVRVALDDAKEMNANAAAEAEKIRNDTIQKVKTERNMVVQTAAKEAEDSYGEIVALGRKHAEQIIEKTGTAEVVQIIKDRVLRRYGNS